MKNSFSFDVLFDSFLDEIKDFVLDGLKDAVKSSNSIKRKDYVYPSGPTFKMRDTCEYLNMGAPKVKQLISEGKLKCNFDNVDYRFNKADLDQFIMDNFVAKQTDNLKQINMKSNEQKKTDEKPKEVKSTEVEKSTDKGKTTVVKTKRLIFITDEIIKPKKNN